MPQQLLFVDDEPFVLEAFRRTLETYDAPWEMTFFESPHEAWRRLVAEPVDVVISDFSMPGMNGWHLADEIRDRWPHLRVGLMTGWGARIEPHEVQAHHVDFLITKPFSLDEILEALESAARTQCGFFSRSARYFP